MVVFDDRRGNMPEIEKAEHEVFFQCANLQSYFELLFSSIVHKNEEDTLKYRYNILKTMRFLEEECEKTRRFYQWEGITEKSAEKFITNK